jgi:MFS family permease
LLIEPDGSAAASWRQHWPVVLAAGVGISLSTVPAYSIGIMIEPIEREFGWSRTAISSGKLITAVAIVLLSPFVGIAVDRFGSRRIGITGAILLCLGLASLSLVEADIRSWWFLWCGIALAGICMGSAVWSAAISSLFDSGRGFALAVALCGGGLSSFLTPIVTHQLVESYGWRMAYVGLGGLWGLFVIPVLFFWFSSARDKHRLQPAARQADVAAILAGHTTREGLRDPAFYKLALAALLASLVITSFIVNFVPILTFGGIGRGTAAAVAGIVGIFSIIGRLSVGMLVDRMDGKRVAAVGVALPVLPALLLLLLPHSVPAAGFAAALLGLALGAELDAVAYLASRYMGLRSFGVLFGTIAGMVSFGGGIGPVAVNYSYDILHSYYPALWIFVPGCLVSSMLFLSLGKIPTFKTAGIEGRRA